jgi:hypothetical protein
MSSGLRMPYTNTSAGAISTRERFVIEATAERARNVRPRIATQREKRSLDAPTGGRKSAAQASSATMGMSMKFTTRGSTGTISVMKRTRTRAAIEPRTSRSPVRSSGDMRSGFASWSSADLPWGRSTTPWERNHERGRPVCSSRASAYGEGSTSPFSSRSISHRDTPSRWARAFSVKPADLRASQIMWVDSAPVGVLSVGALLIMRGYGRPTPASRGQESAEDRPFARAR